MIYNDLSNLHLKNKNIIHVIINLQRKVQREVNIHINNKAIKNKILYLFHYLIN